VYPAQGATQRVISRACSSPTAAAARDDGQEIRAVAGAVASAPIAACKARAEREGKGYQTLINAALQAAIAPEAASVTMEVLRQVP
jgi:predicted DNA binding CopG/RHH family protein